MLWYQYIIYSEIDASLRQYYLVQVIRVNLSFLSQSAPLASAAFIIKRCGYFVKLFLKQTDGKNFSPVYIANDCYLCYYKYNKGK